jgi:branched-chain amino acid transport system permease protein
VARHSALIVGVVAIAALYSLPHLAIDAYLLHVLVLVCINAIPAVGLNLMLGYTGLVSLGHMGLAGVGAYSAAVLMVDAKFGFWVALPLAAAAAAVVGAAIGAVCLRFRSHFFMIVTLAFGLLLYSIFNNWDSVTRGAVGFAGIPRPRPIEWLGGRFGFGTLPNFYYFALTVTLAVFGLQRLLVRSDFGRTLIAIREDERLAIAKGVNIMLFKTAVFAIAAAIAGIGGALHAVFLRVAAPASFSLAESINTVLIVVLGGAGTLLGPAIGALVFVGVPEYLRVASEWRLVIFGALLLVVTRFAPGGIAGLLGTRFSR